MKKGLRNSRSVTVLKVPGINHLLQPNMELWPVVEGKAQALLAPAALTALTNWLQRQTTR